MEFYKILYNFVKFYRISGFVVSPPVELKLRLHTTHPPDFWQGKRSSQYLLLYRLFTTDAHNFWYSNRYCQHLLPYQKSGWWVVCTAYTVRRVSIQPRDLPFSRISRKFSENAPRYAILFAIGFFVCQWTWYQTKQAKLAGYISYFNENIHRNVG